MIGGEAGQGLVTVGELLSRILVRQGYRIVVTQSYQSRIRGGHNTFEVRVSPDGVEAPAEAIDLLVALNDETVTLHMRRALAPAGLVVADEAFCDGGRAVPQGAVQGSRARAHSRTPPRSESSARSSGSRSRRPPRIVDEAFGAKHPEMAEGNRSALAKAFAWCAGKESYFRRLPAAPKGPRRIMLNGNEALALGAVSAGLRFVSFYPMTPSTSIPLTVIGMADRMGIVVEQAEDEIAAINMAIGASFAGAPSMVATSGGGFALMVEGVSLAGMTETPVVIVVGQRPGARDGASDAHRAGRSRVRAPRGARGIPAGDLRSGERRGLLPSRAEGVLPRGGVPGPRFHSHRSVSRRQLPRRRAVRRLGARLGEAGRRSRFDRGAVPAPRDDRRAA